MHLAILPPQRAKDNTMTTAITATLTDSDSSLDNDGYPEYTIDLTVGDTTVTLTGWRLVGWIAPGAHADLDGSGLSLWGSSQTGGWSVCDSSGLDSGVVRVSDDSAEYDAPVCAGSSTDQCIVCEPANVPEWAAACVAVKEAAERMETAYAAYESADESADEALHEECLTAEQAEEDAREAAEKIRNSIVEAVQSALDQAESAVNFPAPTDQEEWDYADELDGDIPQLCAYSLGGVPRIITRLPDGSYDCDSLAGPADLYQAVRIAIAEATDLDGLLDILNAAQSITLPAIVDYSDRESVCAVAAGMLQDLPTYGGSEPRDTSGILSWDAEHVLTYDGDYQIQARCESCGEPEWLCECDD